MTFFTMFAFPNLLLYQYGPDAAALHAIPFSFGFGIALFLAFRKASRSLLLMLPFALLVPVDAAFVYEYHAPLNASTIAIIADTNREEILSYLGGRAGGWILGMAASLAVWCAMYRLVRRAEIEGRQPQTSAIGHWIARCALMGCAALPLLGVYRLVVPDPQREAQIQMLPYRIEDIYKPFPVGRVISYIEYRHARAQTAALNRTLSNFRFGAREEAGFADGNEREIIVLVIGESSRPQNWALFGYGRDTTPNLSRRNDIVPFDNMLSPWPYTAAALPVMLTRKPATAPAIEFFPEKSLLGLYREAGFRTYWLSNQDRKWSAYVALRPFAAEADESVWINTAGDLEFGAASYDDGLLEPMGKILARQERRQFIVLHLMGSHQSYALRYPARAAQFRPAAQPYADAEVNGVADQAAIRNAYDNSIRYTDRTLDRLINVLSATNSRVAMFYTSDHGENLPEQGCHFTGHGHPFEQDYQVSAFAWLSPAYAAAYPAKAEALRRNRQLPSTTGALFSTMADLGGIEYDGRDPSLSLAGNFSPRPRIVNINPTDSVDFDQAGRVGACHELSRRSILARRRSAESGR